MNIFGFFPPNTSVKCIYHVFMFLHGWPNFVDPPFHSEHILSNAFQIGFQSFLMVFFFSTILLCYQPGHFEATEYQTWLNQQRCLLVHTESRAPVILYQPCWVISVIRSRLSPLSASSGWWLFSSGQSFQDYQEPAAAPCCIFSQWVQKRGTFSSAILFLWEKRGSISQSSPFSSGHTD